mgnify:CR=1 FL=1
MNRGLNVKLGFVCSSTGGLPRFGCLALTAELDTEKLACWSYPADGGWDDQGFHLTALPRISDHPESEAYVLRTSSAKIPPLAGGTHAFTCALIFPMAGFPLLLVVRRPPGLRHRLTRLIPRLTVSPAEVTAVFCGAPVPIMVAPRRYAAWAAPPGGGTGPLRPQPARGRARPGTRSRRALHDEGKADGLPGSQCRGGLSAVVWFGLRRVMLVVAAGLFPAVPRLVAARLRSRAPNRSFLKLPFFSLPAACGGLDRVEKVLIGSSEAGAVTGGR